MKIIAALCMLIDHIGMVFFPFQMNYRIIGRLAMPIFAYGVARGAFYTTSLRRYIKKMLLFSFGSQVPFWAMLYAEQGHSFFYPRLNVGFTFLLALGIIALLKWGGYVDVVPEKAKEISSYRLINKEGLNNEQTKSQYVTLTPLMRQWGALVGAFVLLVLGDVMKCDYGSYGILMVLMGYMLWVKKAACRLLWLAVIYLGLTYIFYGNSLQLYLLQSVGVLGYGVIYATQHISERKWRYFFYWYYPVHMLIIAAVKWWMCVR